MFQNLSALWKGFKNFFICNYYCLIQGKNFYPASILPKHTYRSIINIDDLLNKQELYILRRAEISPEDLFTDLGTLNSDAIDLKDIPDLSMNLMGSFFTDKHVKFVPLKKGSQIWPGGVKVYLSDFIDEYKVLTDNFSFFYINLKELHKISIPFEKEKDIQAVNLFKQLKYANTVLGNRIISVNNGTSEIKHAPTYLNYWHIELQIKDPSSKVISRGKSRAASEILSKFLIEHIFSVKSMATLDKVTPARIVKSSYILN